MNINILHLNIETDKHTDKVFDLIEQKKPDIICLVEAMQKDVEKLVARFGYNFIYAPRCIIEKEGEKDEEGVVILSKYKILNTEKHFYGDGVGGELPTHKVENLIVNDYVRPKDRFFDNYTFLTAQIELEDVEKITVGVTHFPVVDHFLPGEKDHELKNLQNVDDLEHTKIYLDQIINWIRQVPGPLIFTADLNSARGEYFYTTLAQELIDQVPTSLKTSLDPVLHRAKHIELMVDAFMTTPDFSVNSFEIIEGVSDHKAFFVSLEIKKQSDL